MTHDPRQTVPAARSGDSPLAALPRLGMGCWAIGGPFHADGTPLGYGETDDAVSRDALRAAREAGVRVFDTAAVYGAGHSERLVGEVLGNDPDVAIVTKLGVAFDETTRAVSGPDASPEHVERAVEASLRRLRRERADVVLLHLNALPWEEAEPLFERLERLRERGLVAAFGWSTDFAEPLERAAERFGGEAGGFVAVEHSMNLFVPASRLVAVTERHALAGLCRSPLAMGLLGGRYDAAHRFADDDVRSNDLDWMDYFEGGAVRARFAQDLDAVRELLASEGRSLAQGALCWLLARSDRALPVPGARTPEQARENAAALEHGPLPAATMAEIERLIERPPEGPDRER